MTEPEDDAIDDRLAGLETEERQQDDEQLREEADTTNRIVESLTNPDDSAPAKRQ